MRETKYKNFSLKTHLKNIRIGKPSTCQFELTFACRLHCRHCYTDCYNKSDLLKKEMETKEVRAVLNKLYKSGVIWLCLTGGDPLARNDFLDVYSYAKQKGFITTLFTSGYSLTDEIVRYLKKSPPFAIELTLNGITKETYEKISGVEGSFDRVMKGIDLILGAGLPLKIKTLMTKDNLTEIKGIRKFAEKKGARVEQTYLIHPRLNGDLTPCDFRLSAKDISEVILPLCKGESEGVEVFSTLPNPPLQREGELRQQPSLFRCVVGSGDAIWVDPYGNAFFCQLIRNHSFNLLEKDIEYGFRNILPFFKTAKFNIDAKCKTCDAIEYCSNCPGNAYLETGDMQSAVEYYCNTANVAVLPLCPPKAGPPLEDKGESEGVESIYLPSPLLTKEGNSSPL